MLMAFGVFAQPNGESPPTAIQFFDVAKNHIKLANYDNAIAAMLQAVALSPESILFTQELGKLYLINKQHKEADKIFNKLIKNELADENTYKYASEAKIALDDFESAKDLLKEGLGKFPNSGLLYYTKGNLYDYYKEFSQAINAYEKGIELDPQFALNYYNAAKMQLKNPNNYVACIIYAETYIALDPFTYRAEEMKTLLYNGYNRLFILLRSDKDVFPQNNPIFKNKGRAFESRILEVMETCKQYILKNNNAANLNLFRTKFIVEWFRKQPCSMPASIFSRQQLYIIEGKFATYNNWLFGPTSNIAEYEKWLGANEGNIKDLNLFFKEHPYVPENHNKKK
jgi:tetratricopeptide (TPR) repeat protein